MIGDRRGTIRAALATATAAATPGLLHGGHAAPSTGPPSRQITDSIGMRLTLVPAGEFLMGSPREYAEAMAARVADAWYRDSAPSEWPQRRVRICRPFFIGTFEVRLAEFRQFVEATGYRSEAESDGRGADGRDPAGRWSTRPEFK